MYGPGYAPPPPPQRRHAWVVPLRVLFAALALLSCGLLAWATMLRLALVTRSRLHWTLFGVTIVIFTGSLITLGLQPTQPPDAPATRATDITMIVSLLTAVAVFCYYLYAEIDHFGAQHAPPPPHPAPPPGYYVPPQPPQPPQQPQQFGYGYPAQQPPPRPSQPRIDQVRAELDDLSDILRNRRDDT
ncbi:hypothetical protein [Streptomyces sp. NPDC093109]|uniref:hypothetical protein n=1 Tax=Streptomyces sp. NPDC093109 TaxID=3154977 RepID=UPI0034500CF2